MGRKWRPLRRRWIPRERRDQGCRGGAGARGAVQCERIGEEVGRSVVLGWFSCFFCSSLMLLVVSCLAREGAVLRQLLLDMQVKRKGHGNKYFFVGPYLYRYECIYVKLWCTVYRLCSPPPTSLNSIFVGRGTDGLALLVYYVALLIG